MRKGTLKRRVLSLLAVMAMSVLLIPSAAMASETSDPEGIEPQEANTTYVAWIGETGYETLEAAVNAAQSGDTIKLAAGKYTLYNKGAQTKGKDLTFEGVGAETEWGIGATVPDPSKFGTEYNGDYSFDGAGTITFKNMTLQSGSVDYLGFIRADHTVVENCTVKGKTFYWGYKTATFTNTTFDAPTMDYALWTYSSPEMTFDTCTFNTTGKVINVYRDYAGTAYTINFKDCTVNNSLVALKQVLNINDSYPSGQSYTINISGKNTITGTDLNPDSITCSRLFGFGGKKNNNAGNTMVNIDGTQVWTTGKMVSHSIDTANDKYTDGYEEDKFTTTYGEWEKQDNGSLKRTVTKVCDYCGYTETATEEKGPYILSYDLNGGTAASGADYAAQTVTPGEKATVKAAPTRTDYIFAGWNTAADGSGTAYEAGAEIEISENVTLYAQWTKEPTYSVTYNDGLENAVIFEDQVTTGLKAGAKTPAFTGSLKRSGFKFTGWSPEVSDTVTGNVIYVAQWERTGNRGSNGTTTNINTNKNAAQTSTAAKTASVKTGDSANITLWIGLAVVAVAAVGGVTVYYKKKQSK